MYLAYSDRLRQTDRNILKSLNRLEESPCMEMEILTTVNSLIADNPSLDDDDFD